MPYTVVAEETLQADSDQHKTPAGQMMQAHHVSTAMANQRRVGEKADKKTDANGSVWVIMITWLTQRNDDPLIWERLCVWSACDKMWLLCLLCPATTTFLV